MSYRQKERTTVELAVAIGRLVRGQPHDVACSALGSVLGAVLRAASVDERCNSVGILSRHLTHVLQEAEVDQD